MMWNFSARLGINPQVQRSVEVVEFRTDDVECFRGIEQDGARLNGVLHAAGTCSL